MKLNKLFVSSLIAILPVVNVQAITTERVSIGPVTGGTSTNGVDELPAVSSDGRFAVYESVSTDIVAGDSNNLKDIFVRDRSSGSNTRVSVSSAGAQSNGTSFNSDISNDGRYVVFTSRASNLTSDTIVNGTTGATSGNVFLHDRDTGITTLISKADGLSTSTSSGNGASNRPVISGNGQYIAYESASTNILASDTDARFDIYLYNIASGTTSLVSVSSTGVKGNMRSLEADISDTGQFVAFSSDATNLHNGPDGAARDVFVRDIILGTTTPITSGSAATPSGQTDSQQPSISADGNLVVFESYRQNLVPGDDNLVQDVYIYNRSRNEYRRVSVSSLGVQADARSGHPGVSSDGRYVVFESSATNLVSNDTNGQLDIYVHDLQLAQTDRVSVDSAGAQGSGRSQKPEISRDGNFVIYSTTNSFASDDINGNEDIYITTLATVTQSPTPTLDPTDTTGTDFLEVFNDFNGDERSDVLWRDENNGEVWIYLMNGNNILSKGFVIAVPDLNYKMVAVGDFDGDGKDDIFWRNQITGENYVALMNGFGIKSLALLSTVGSSWKVSGIGDFDNDGKYDVFWSNTVTGEHGMYLMNGIGIRSISSLITVGLEWQVAGVGDFDNDGKSDILWENNITSEHYVFLMNGTVSSAVGPLITAPAGWFVDGIGDFDGDGKSDTLWRNRDTGQYWVLLMNGIGFTTSQSLFSVPELSWEMRTVGDFDGDGKSDTFWRNNVSGINWQVQLNGPNIKTSQQVDVNPDLNWKIRGKIE